MGDKCATVYEGLTKNLVHSKCYINARHYYVQLVLHTKREKCGQPGEDLTDLYNDLSNDGCASKSQFSQIKNEDIAKLFVNACQALKAHDPTENWQNQPWHKF